MQILTRISTCLDAHMRAEGQKAGRVALGVLAARKDAPTKGSYQLSLNKWGNRANRISSPTRGEAKAKAPKATGQARSHVKLPVWNASYLLAKLGGAGQLPSASRTYAAR